MSYIDQHICSATHFNAIIKQQTHSTPSDWLRSVVCLFSWIIERLERKKADASDLIQLKLMSSKNICNIQMIAITELKPKLNHNPNHFRYCESTFDGKFQLLLSHIIAWSSPSYRNQYTYSYSEGLECKLPTVHELILWDLRLDLPAVICHCTLKLLCISNLPGKSMFNISCIGVFFFKHTIYPVYTALKT